MYEYITCPILLRMMYFLFSLRTEWFITFRVFITKRVVTVSSLKRRELAQLILKLLITVTQCARKRTCAKRTFARLTLLEMLPSYMRTHTSYSYNPLSSYAEASYSLTHSFNSYYYLTLTLTLTLVICCTSYSSPVCVVCLRVCVVLCCVLSVSLPYPCYTHCVRRVYICLSVSVCLSLSVCLCLARLVYITLTLTLLVCMCVCVCMCMCVCVCVYVYVCVLCVMCYVLSVSFVSFILPPELFDLFDPFVRFEYLECLECLECSNCSSNSSLPPYPFPIP